MIDFEKSIEKKFPVFEMEIEFLQKYKEYSVTLPLINVSGRYHILFEIRSQSLYEQPCEVCFPGGRVEKDEYPIQAALRETYEELGIKPVDIKIIGRMKPWIPQFMSVIHPFIAVLKKDDFHINPMEVEDIFCVPVEYFFNTVPEQGCTEIVVKPSENFPYHLIQAGRDYKWRNVSMPVYFYKYKERIIWGLTAFITKVFSQMLKDEV